MPWIQQSAKVLWVYRAARVWLEANANPPLNSRWWWIRCILQLLLATVLIPPSAFVPRTANDSLATLRHLPTRPTLSPTLLIRPWILIWVLPRSDPRLTPSILITLQPPTFPAWLVFIREVITRTWVLSTVQAEYKGHRLMFGSFCCLHFYSQTRWFHSLGFVLLNVICTLHYVTLHYITLQRPCVVCSRVHKMSHNVHTFEVEMFFCREIALDIFRSDRCHFL